MALESLVSELTGGTKAAPLNPAAVTNKKDAMMASLKRAFRAKQMAFLQENEREQLKERLVAAD